MCVRIDLIDYVTSRTLRYGYGVCACERDAVKDMTPPPSPQRTVLSIFCTLLWLVGGPVMSSAITLMEASRYANENLVDFLMPKIATVSTVAIHTESQYSPMDCLVSICYTHMGTHQAHAHLGAHHFHVSSALSACPGHWLPLPGTVRDGCPAGSHGTEGAPDQRQVH